VENQQKCRDHKGSIQIGEYFFRKEYGNQEANQRKPGSLVLDVHFTFIGFLSLPQQSEIPQKNEIFKQIAPYAHSPKQHTAKNNLKNMEIHKIFKK
jgi:hypothetical protein